MDYRNFHLAMNVGKCNSDIFAGIFVHANLCQAVVWLSLLRVARSTSAGCFVLRTLPNPYEVTGLLA
jgi:hypothetical protein